MTPKSVAVSVLAAIVLLSGCNKQTPTAPAGDPISPASFLVEYTGVIAGERQVSLGISTENFARNNFVMSKTGPNTWEWQGDAELLDTLQEDVDTSFLVSDGNWSNQQGFKGHPIRVSILRDGAVLSSAETTAEDVWFQTQTPTRTIYWGRFWLERDDTVRMISGPGEREPLPTTVLEVRYVGQVSGEETVYLTFDSEPFRGQLPMNKTGSRTWSYPIDPVRLRQFQEDGGEIVMYIWDLNRPSGRKHVGHPIRLSIVQDGGTLSTLNTTARDVWQFDWPNSNIAYFIKLRFRLDNTIVLIPGPGIPQ